MEQSNLQWIKVNRPININRFAGADYIVIDLKTDIKEGDYCFIQTSTGSMIKKVTKINPTTYQFADDITSEVYKADDIKQINKIIKVSIDC